MQTADLSHLGEWEKFLTCYLDARVHTSVSNGSKVWNDLTRRGNSFHFERSLISDGVAVDVYSGGVGQGPSAPSLEITRAYTINLIAKCKIATESFPFYIRQKTPTVKDTAAETTARGVSCHVIWPDNKVYFDNMGCCETAVNRVVYDMGSSFQVMEHMYTFVKTVNGNLLIYLDGKQVAVTDNGASPIPKLTGPTFINMNGMWRADLKVLQVFNTDLSTAQIADLYQHHQALDKTLRIANRETRIGSLLQHDLPVKSGLLLAFNAGDQRCYNETTGEVTDLTGRFGRGAFKFRTSAAVPLKNGAWQTSVDNPLIGPPSSSLGLRDIMNFTVVYTCVLDKDTKNTLMTLYGTDSQGRDAEALSIQHGWMDGQLHYRQGLINCTTSVQGLPMSTFCVKRNRVSVNLYIDGQLVSSVPRRGMTPQTVISCLEKEAIFFALSGQVSHLYIYDCALKDEQIKAMAEYCVNPFFIGDKTWQEARSHCRGKLPASQSLCEGGVSNFRIPYVSGDTAALVPVSDAPNTWLDLRKCKTQIIGERQRGALIQCNKERNTNGLTAAALDDNVVYFFRRDLVAQYDYNLHETKATGKISDTFPGLPVFFHKGIDSAYFIGTSLTLYRDNILVTYDIKEKKVTAQPQQIKKVFPNLPSTFQEDLDGAVISGFTADTEIVFYKGSQVCVMSADRRTVLKPWPYNVPILSNGISGLLQFRGVLYLFKERYLYNTKVNSVDTIINNFPGLTPPLVSVASRCKILTKRIPQLRLQMEETRGTSPALYAQYETQLKNAEREERSYCSYTTMYSLQETLSRQRETSKTLESDLQEYTKRQRQAQLELADSEQKYRLISQQRSDLQNQVSLRGKVPCPTDSNCLVKTAPSVYVYDVTSDRQRPLLTDIRQYPDFYQYVERNKIRSCPVKPATQTSAQASFQAPTQASFQTQTQAQAQTQTQASFQTQTQTQASTPFRTMPRLDLQVTQELHSRNAVISEEWANKTALTLLKETVSQYGSRM